jgi:hypothetical protein
LGGDKAALTLGWAAHIGLATTTFILGAEHVRFDLFVLGRGHVLACILLLTCLGQALFQRPDAFWPSEPFFGFQYFVESPLNYRKKTT